MIAGENPMTRASRFDSHDLWLMSCIARLMAFMAAGAFIGWISWGQGESFWGLLGVLALPLMWGASGSRWEGLTLMLAYYSSGARGLPSGAVVFFGDMAPHWWGLAMWLAASVVLSLPFALFWASAPDKRAIGFLMGLFACLLPPLGIFGWLNPLSVAGLLFPSAGWVGLAMTVAVFLALARRWRVLLIGLALTGAVLNAGATHGAASAPARWLGFDTSFSKLSGADADQASQFLGSEQRIEWLRRIVADMPGDATLVLPETVIGRFDGVAQALLEEAEGELVSKNSRVLVGAELPLASGRYRNAVVVLGARQHEDRVAIQGIPVPISMWKPWANDGAEADLLARSNTIAVDGVRVGVSVCYEQLLAYSLLRLMADKPDVIATVSNVWWARSTNIPMIMFQSAHAFARLFNVPVVSAKNI